MMEAYGVGDWVMLNSGHTVTIIEVKHNGYTVATSRDAGDNGFVKPESIWRLVRRSGSRRS